MGPCTGQRLILSGSQTVAHICYWTYAAMWGALMAPMIAFTFAVNGGGHKTG